jgi:hypothetical protein
MQIDDNFLYSIGIDVNNLSEDQKKKAFAQILDIFRIRLGVKITANLSDEKLEEFTDTTNNNGNVLEWITSNVPDYEQIGDEVIAELHNELQQKHQEVLGL